jgi:hypothetical protein
MLLRAPRFSLVLLVAALLICGPWSVSRSGAWEGSPRTFVVLRPDAPGRIQDFVRVLSESGGHVSVVYPPRSAVVYATDAVLARDEVRAWTELASRGAVAPAALRDADEATQRAARAWTLSLEMGSAPFGVPDGFVPTPDAGPRPVPLGKGPDPRRTAVSDNLPFGAEYYDTSEFLAGSSAVGVWLLEAAGATYDWTQAEEDQTLAGVQAGLDKWVEKGGPPAFLTFYLDIHTDVPVSGVPITSPQSWDGVWMDEVMNNEGWSGADAWDKCFAYNNAIRDTFDTNWCFSIVIVDSDPSVNQGLFSGGGYAWAYYGGPWVYMSRYSTWAFNFPNYYGVVPMHEVGHIFMDTDEYDGIAQFSGYLNVSDNPSTSVLCIMNQNDSTRVCNPTRRQLGWRDADGDSIIEPLDTEPGVTLTPLSPDPTMDATPTWNGSSTVTTLDNLNPNSNYGTPHDMTIATIDAVECRVDAGAWSPATAGDGAFDDYVEAFVWTSDPLTPGVHIVEARAHTNVGNWSTVFAADTITVEAGVGVPESPATPARVALEAAEPNPMMDASTVRFALPASGPAQLVVIGPDGRRVRTLVDATLPAGAQQETWDGRDDSGRIVPSGVYFLRLTCGGGEASRKVLVAR